MRHTIKAPLAPAVHAHGHTQHEMCPPHMQTLCGAKAQPTGHSSSELSPACPSPDSHATARLHTDACPLLLVISILALQENKTQVAPPQSCGRGPRPQVRRTPPPRQPTPRIRWKWTCKETAPARFHQAFWKPPSKLRYWLGSEGVRGHTVTQRLTVCGTAAQPGPAVNGEVCRGLAPSQTTSALLPKARRPENVPIRCLNGQEVLLLRPPIPGPGSLC